jgi:hypothetical protein
VATFVLVLGLLLVYVAVTGKLKAITEILFK